MFTLLSAVVRALMVNETFEGCRSRFILDLQAAADIDALNAAAQQGREHRDVEFVAVRDAWEQSDAASKSNRLDTELVAARESLRALHADRERLERAIDFALENGQP